MARSRPPAPPVPTPAERARTLAGRARHAAVIGEPEQSDGDLRAAPTLHHVPATGAATLQFPDDHALVLAARERGDALLPVMLELSDVAPVSVRRPVRGLLWVSGRLRVLPLRVARRAALRIAAEQPDERLLDVGHGETLLRLEPTMVVLSDAEGTEALAPTAVAAAAPDPVAATGDALARPPRRRAHEHPLGARAAAADPPAAPRDTASPRSASTATACGCASSPRTTTTTCACRSTRRCRAPASSARPCAPSSACPDEAPGVRPTSRRAAGA